MPLSYKKARCGKGKAPHRLCLADLLAEDVVKLLATPAQGFLHDFGVGPTNASSQQDSKAHHSRGAIILHLVFVTVVSGTARAHTTPVPNGPGFTGSPPKVARRPSPQAGHPKSRSHNRNKLSAPAPCLDLNHAAVLLRLPGTFAMSCTCCGRETRTATPSCRAARRPLARGGWRCGMEERSRMWRRRRPGRRRGRRCCCIQMASSCIVAHDVHEGDESCITDDACPLIW